MCSWYTTHLLGSFSRGALSCFHVWLLVGSVMTEPRNVTPLPSVMASLHGSLFVEPRRSTSFSLPSRFPSSLSRSPPRSSFSYTWSS